MANSILVYDGTKSSWWCPHFVLYLVGITFASRSEIIGPFFAIFSVNFEKERQTCEFEAHGNGRDEKKVKTPTFPNDFFFSFFQPELLPRRGVREIKSSGRPPQITKRSAEETPPPLMKSQDNWDPGRARFPAKERGRERKQIFILLLLASFSYSSVLFRPMLAR